MAAILIPFPDLDLHVDRDGRILACRGRPLDRFLDVPETLVGKRVQEIDSAPFREALCRALAHLHVTGDPVAIEFTLDLEGEERHFEARVVPTAGDECVAIVRDVSERLRSERDLARQRQFLRDVIDLNPQLVFAKDRQGRYTLANVAAAAAYGTTVESLLGRSDADFHPDPQAVRQIRIDDLEVIQTKDDKVIHEHPVPEPDGFLRWYSTVKRAIQGPDGSDQVLGVSTDVTERRLMEDRLRERNERLARHQEHLHRLAILDWPDLDGTLTQIAHAASEALRVKRVGVWLFTDDRSALRCRLLYEGRLRHEMAGAVVEAKRFPAYFEAIEASRTMAVDLAQYDPQTSAFYDSHLRPHGIGALLGASIRVRGRTVGVVRHEHVGPPRLWAQEEEQFAASIADLVALAISTAERREIEAQLLQSQKMEAVGVLAGGVAHDFNNLLTAILGYADILAKRLEGNAALRDLAGEIRSAGERASGLTRQLLAFSRKQVIHPRTVDLNEIVRGVAPMLRRLIGEDVVLLTVLAPESLFLRADPGQIEQVIMNLAINARDALPAGGTVTISTFRRPPSGRDEAGDTVAQAGAIGLRVSDTGTGMDAETKARIFEPFFTTKGQGQGTGLGLSTVYGIVRQSDGEIRVESAPGQGSHFEMSFPAVTPPASRSDPDARVERPDRLTGRVVLLVEDEGLVRTLASHVLRSQGAQVIEASCGTEALERAEAATCRIDLLLTDVVMPGMNGRELAERLLKSCPETKVLFMSGYPNPALGGAASFGRENFLLKPFAPAKLVDAAEHALANSQARTAAA